jgi:hypothetical protein
VPGQILDVVQTVAREVGEGSRYHGYSDAQAPVFLAYQIDKVVDLRDPTAEYPDFWPPTPFDTGALFAPEFASHWGYKDPDDGHDLPLCEIFERGLANELWIAAEAGTRNVYENQSYVQIYDDQTQPTGRFSKCTNGCFSDPGDARRRTGLRAHHGRSGAVENRAHLRDGLHRRRLGTRPANG